MTVFHYQQLFGCFEFIQDICEKSFVTEARAYMKEVSFADLSFYLKERRWVLVV